MEYIKQYLGLRCYDNCLSYIIEQEGQAAKKFWGHMFRLPYENGELLGDKLKFDTEIKLLLEKYAGLISQINSEYQPGKWMFQKGHYTILKIDTYYYHVHRLYQEEHTDHFCLYAGADQDKIYVIDPMMSEKIESIPMEELQIGFMNAEYLRFREIGPFSVDMQIGDLDLYYGLRKETEHIELIIEWMKNHFDLQNEFRGLKEKKYDIPLYRALWAIMFSRSCYCDMLKNIPIDIAEKELVQENLQGLFESWRELRGALVKAYYQNKKQIDEDLYQLVTGILSKEKETMECNIDMLRTMKRLI